MTIIDPIHVGFWKTEGHAPRLPFESVGLLGRVAALLIGDALEAHLPSVWDHIDRNWDPREREKVLRYVSDPRHRSTAYMGFSTCRICGKSNGTADFSDGWYVWPEGFGHYISQHSVRPPKAFVAHVMGRERDPR